MHNRKKVESRMDPRGTLALIGYSCEDFPSRTSRNHLLLKKRQNKTKYLTRNSIRLEFCEEHQYAKLYRKPWI